MSARTANWIAAARARESTRADRLFDDRWAAHLAGPAGFEMLAGPDNPFLPVRTRFFDDLVEDRRGRAVTPPVLSSRAGQPLPYCTDDPRGLLLRCGWDVEAMVEPGQPRANFGRLRPVPENWSGGGTYLMVGSRPVSRPGRS